MWTYFNGNTGVIELIRASLFITSVVSLAWITLGSILQALGRPEDMLHDTAYLQFKPIFARLLQTGPLLLE